MKNLNSVIGVELEMFPPFLTECVILCTINMEDECLYRQSNSISIRRICLVHANEIMT